MYVFLVLAVVAFSYYMENKNKSQNVKNGIVTWSEGLFTQSGKVVKFDKDFVIVELKNGTFKTVPISNISR